MFINAKIINHARFFFLADFHKAINFHTADQITIIASIHIEIPNCEEICDNTNQMKNSFSVRGGGNSFCTRTKT